jgi:hypothetical protein
MSLTQLNTALQDSKRDDAVVMIVTNQNRVIELSVYCRLIIGFKSRLLSYSDILNNLEQGNIKEFVVSERRPALEQLDPAAVADALMLMAPLALGNGMLTRRLGCLVALLHHLSLGDDDNHNRAFEALCSEIAKAKPNFSLNGDELSQRAARLVQDLAITPSILQTDSSKSGNTGILSWIKEIMQIVEDPIMRDTIISSLLLGDTAKAYFNITADRASGLGSKPGIGRLAKAFYPQYLGYTKAAIYRDLTRIGDIYIDWHSEKRDIIYITKPDLEKFRINRGERLTVIFTA